MRWRLCGLVVVCVAWLAVSAGSSGLNMHCLPADGGVPDNTTLGGCPACRLRSEVREMSLAAIKELVLGRLGYVQAPNITGRQLPKVLPDMLANFERQKKREAEMEMMSDQPNRYSIFEEDDDYRAKTEKIFVFHPQCKTPDLVASDVTTMWIRLD